MHLLIHIIKHKTMMELKKYSLLVLLSVLVVFSCTDEDLVPEPVPETAVHGYIERTTAIENFLYDDMDQGLDFNFSWVSVDSKNTVTKIEFYVSFNEVYSDFEGGAKTASHKEYLFKTIDNPKGNRETEAFSMDQAALYALYKDDTFAYDITDGADAAQAVFGFSQKLNRDAASSPWVDGDSFRIRWVMTTADGRTFDTWNDSICLEFPGANCTFSWAVVCSQIVPVAAGDITITGTESYGDGWNDATIDVIIDGVRTSYAITDSGVGSETWTISLDGSEGEIYFEFISGDWDSEITFDIVYMDGTNIASWGPSPPAGKVVVNLCTL
jgi:hypothetical protein